MARRRKKRASRTRSRKSVGLSSRRSPRRRRRMSAGLNTSKIFKMVSDPLIGGVVGAAAGIILKNLAKKFVKENEMLATAVPVVLAFLLRKKAGALAAGMAGAPILLFAGKKVPMLAENFSVNFADPLLLAADGRLLAEYGYKLNENGYDSTGMDISEDDLDYYF